MKKREKWDLALVFVWPIFAAWLSFLFKANAFFSIILFLVIPSIYLSLKGRSYIKKAALFSLIPTLLMIIVDYLAHYNKSWLIPNSIIPYRLFGFITFEVLFWTFFMSYFILIFYEYFLDKHITKDAWKPKMKWLTNITLIALVGFLIVLFKFPNLLRMPYFYFWFGIVLILIPIIFEALKYPKVFSKFSLAFVYFFILTFIYEVTALKLGWWAFPGTEFIGNINLLGVSFPLEEFFFWFVLTALAILSAFEFFDDDEK